MTDQAFRSWYVTYMFEERYGEERSRWIESWRSYICGHGGIRLEFAECIAFPVTRDDFDLLHHVLEDMVKVDFNFPIRISILSMVPMQKPSSPPADPTQKEARRRCRLNRLQTRVSLDLVGPRSLRISAVPPG